MEATNNPYQTPEGQLTNDSQAHGEIKFFSPATRIGRLRYLAHSFLMGLASYAVLGGAAALALLVSGIFWGLFALGYVAIIVFSVILMIQRLHDLNKSGWLALLMLVPLVNFFFIIYIIFWSGTPGRNNFGLQPPPNQTWHWILGLAGPILGAIAMIGILAAVALPAYQQYSERAQGVESTSDYEQYDDDTGEYSGDYIEPTDEYETEPTDDYDDSQEYNNSEEDEYSDDEQTE